MKAQSTMKLKLHRNSSQWPQQGSQNQLTTWWWLEVPSLLAVRPTY